MSQLGTTRHGKGMDTGTSKTDAKMAADRQSRTFAWAVCACVGLVASIPTLIGALRQDGYLGFQYNVDDHMVYSAWMRQAMDGHFLFDNRFTLDAQPGLTIHLYFWALGMIAKLIGLSGAATLGRIGFSVLFVWLAHRLICRLTPDVFARKLALALTVLGGGVGFAVWHNFGVAIVRPTPGPIIGLMSGRLPIDVWQPEAFVFPSMLTNGLFMVSLCLIVGALICVVGSRDSWRPVPAGLLCFALLANIHTYDVALLGMVLGAYLAMGLARRQVTAAWVVRVLAMAAGVVVPALWLAHVLRSDPVFQARAATETYSANFRQVFWGLILLVVPALIGLWLRNDAQERSPWPRRIGLGILAVALGALFVMSGGHDPGGYWMGMTAWCCCYLAAVGILCLVASSDPTKNLLWAWAIVGLVALYFPALFQRKLAMGLAVPWSILAAIGMAGVIMRIERGARNVATALTILVLSLSSLMWFARERTMIGQDLSNTARHPVFLSADVRRIVDYLNREQGPRTVVLAMPGVWSPGSEPDTFGPPAMPDLSPLLTGLTGVYTYAGHWSETPDYLGRNARVAAIYLAERTDEAAVRAFLEETRADYVVAPVPEAFQGVRDMRRFGEVVVDGPQFRLVKVR